jgi:NADH-quinone oxidoreductase subunit I
MKGFGDYIKTVWAGLSTTLVGMGITFRYIWTKPVTVQYPEERMNIAPRYRGIHYLEQDLCIACRACEKACPIDCIEIRFERHPGSVNEWYEFSLDYNKCMFCELCCFPCPKTCIHMGREFSLVKYHRNELVHDLLTWTGMRDLDRDTVAKAEEAKRKKAEAAAAKKKALAEKKAAEAKAAKDSKPKDGPDKSSEQSGEKN